MAKTSHWAALYFVALMTFGNYVLFNLLVAILVEGFSSERNERREREQREMARRKMSCILEGGSLRGSSEETSRSVSSSSGSYVQVCRRNQRRLAELTGLTLAGCQKLLEIRGRVEESQGFQRAKGAHRIDQLQLQREADREGLLLYRRAQV
jgi:hypothetical protein